MDRVFRASPFLGDPREFMLKLFDLHNFQRNQSKEERTIKRRHRRNLFEGRELQRDISSMATHTHKCLK